MAENILLIVNPVSGKGRARSVLSGVVYALAEGENAVTVRMTRYAGHADVLAEEYGPAADTVVCIGGDGTLSGVINGLMRLPEAQRPKVGYIPLGTTNDMAISYHVPRVPQTAAQRIVEGSPRIIDVGACSTGHFGYILAFGAFTEVSFATPQESKNAFGKLAYLAEGAASLQKLTSHHMVVEYDGGVLEGDYMFGAICNTTSVAGILKIAPKDAMLDDGLLELLLIKKPENPLELNAALTGLLSQNYNNGGVLTLLHTKHVRITGEKPVVWTRDGENGGSHAVMEAHVCPGALRLMR